MEQEESDLPAPQDKQVFFLLNFSAKATFHILLNQLVTDKVKSNEEQSPLAKGT